jgi:hypothetical protein
MILIRLRYEIIQLLIIKLTYIQLPRNLPHEFLHFFFIKLTTFIQIILLEMLFWMSLKFFWVIECLFKNAYFELLGKLIIVHENLFLDFVFYFIKA